MTIFKDVLDELLSGVENADDLLGDQGLMKALQVKLMERMLGAELTEHLGYEPDAEPANQQSNRRNGTSRKTLKGNDGALPIDVPRDRDGSFEPELIKKGQTRIDGMDDKIIGLYAAGLSTRDIRAHLEEVYGLKVSADLVSRVTDAVLEEVSDWQNRDLEPMYPVVFLDALRVKIRDAVSRQVKNKAVYVALGVNAEGEREVPARIIDALLDAIMAEGFREGARQASLGRTSFDLREQPLLVLEMAFLNIPEDAEFNQVLVDRYDAVTRATLDMLTFATLNPENRNSLYGVEVVNFQLQGFLLAHA